ncbi:hypothetical protein [Kitasatospora aureofaciens]|uniref:hypothetical protein n=1 Tax=Kitasatospora aureofaciens TaxID=1894 RepID=UPI00131D2B55|nr:hypothetical protein [Kitasatospora aureofaciens]
MTGQVIAQRKVGSKTNGTTVFKSLLAPLDLAGTVVTFDALHSQTEHARFLVEPKRLPWRHVPLQGRARATTHGRDEVRRIKTCPRRARPRLPSRRPGRAPPPDRHHRQGHPRTRLRRDWLRPHQAAPADLASWVRGHWGIENKIHHVRDATYAEAPARAPVPSPGQWPACATSPSLPSGTSATTTSRPGSAITPADPRRPLATVGIT